MTYPSFTDACAASNNLKVWGVSFWTWDNGRSNAPVLVDLPTRTMSLLRGRSTASLTIQGDLPKAGTTVELNLTLTFSDGTIYADRFFSGKVADTAFSASSNTRTVNLVDHLDLNREMGQEMTWTNKPWDDAFRDLMGRAGIAADKVSFDPRLDHLHADYTHSIYNLGSVYPITVSGRETIQTVAKQLLDFAGCGVYVRGSGQLFISPLDLIPLSSSVTRYAEDPMYFASPSNPQDIIFELGIFDAGMSIEGNEGITNRYTATGPTYNGSTPTGTSSVTAIGTAATAQFPYAQTDAVCDAIAYREIGKLGRDRKNLWFEAPLNPALVPGQTIMFRCPRIGYTNDTPMLVMEVSTTSDMGMRVVMVQGMSIRDGAATDTKTPIADFTMRVETENTYVGDVSIQTYFVTCTDTSVDRSGGGSIKVWSWVATDATVPASPVTQSKSGRTATFTFIHWSDKVTIALTVQSSNGRTGTVTRTVMSEDVLYTRVLSAAMQTQGWMVQTPNREWKTYDGAYSYTTTITPSTAVPTPTPGLYRYALNTNCQLIRTLSGVDVEVRPARPGYVATCMWVNEGTPAHVLVQETHTGFSGFWYVSEDNGDTWTEYPVGLGVLDCHTLATNPHEVRLCIENMVWLTPNFSSATSIITGEIGTIARKLCYAYGDTVAVFTGTGISTANSLKSATGKTFNWPATDLPTDGLNSISALSGQQGYFVTAEGSGTVYRALWNGSSYDVVKYVPGTTTTTVPASDTLCVAVPPICTGEYLYALWNDCRLTRTGNYLTAPPLQCRPAKSDNYASSMWVNEGDPAYIIVAEKNRDTPHRPVLYASRDEGNTWIGPYIHPTSTASILDCHSHPTKPNEVRICTGKYVQMSANLGLIAFLTIITGTTGTLARKLCYAYGDTVAVFSGTDIAIGDVVKSALGRTFDWSAVTAVTDASPLTGLSSITALSGGIKGYLLGEGRGLINDPDLGQITYTVGHPTGADKVYKALWSDSVSSYVVTMIDAVPGVTPGKIAGDLLATSDDTVAYRAAKTYTGLSTDLRIGIGGLRSQINTVKIIFPTRGIAHASNGGLYIYLTGYWTRINGPVDAAFWSALVVNPLNKDEWLLVGNSATNGLGCDLPYSAGAPLVMNDNAHSCAWHHTLDSNKADVWTSITLTQPTITITPAVTVIRIMDIGWGESGGWWIAATSFNTQIPNTAAGYDRPMLWRQNSGESTAAIAASIDYGASFMGRCSHAITGQAGDVIIVGDAAGNNRIITVSVGGLWSVASNTHYVGGTYPPTIVPATRFMYQPHSYPLAHPDITPNYMTTLPTEYTSIEPVRNMIALPGGDLIMYRSTDNAALNPEHHLIRVKAGVETENESALAVCTNLIATQRYPFGPLISNASRSFIMVKLFSPFVSIGTPHAFAVYDVADDLWSILEYPTGVTTFSMGGADAIPGITEKP